jgi:hypothetical protein
MVTDTAVMARAPLVGGAEAGAVIAEIVEVGAEQHLGEAERIGARAGDLQQLRFAVVAAIGGVRGEDGALELMRVAELDRRADERGEIARRLLLAGRHRD